MSWERPRGVDFLDLPPKSCFSPLAFSAKKGGTLQQKKTPPYFPMLPPFPYPRGVGLDGPETLVGTKEEKAK